MYQITKKPKVMKTVTINFGTGKEKVSHIIEVSNPSQITDYLTDLKNNGWNLNDISSILGGWTF